MGTTTMSVLSALLAICVFVPLSARPRQGVAAPAATGVPQARMESRGGTSVMSPSVLASAAMRRDASGLTTVDILVLWRGSPGWLYRRTGLGGAMSGGSPARDGTISISVQQGGLQLTAHYDPAVQVATILGERVQMKGANVVFVDRVDSPDGPVIAGTATVPPRIATVDVAPLLRDTPELLAYLRCEAQLPKPMNESAMQQVCAEAMFRGIVKAPRTVTPVPTGPVTNRAAATAPPARPAPPTGPGEGTSNGVVSPVAVAGWFTSRDGAGTERLDLLVLWRGSLGWGLRGQSSGASGGGGMGSRRGMTVQYGGRSLYAALDAASVGGRTAQIEDAKITLGDHNVVLVDEVDSASGPRVVKTLRVDAALPEPRRIDLVIARSPELVAYLRCDLKLPDPKQQAMMDVVCARLTGK
jgi:hypothetical protein